MCRNDCDMERRVSGLFYMRQTKGKLKKIREIKSWPYTLFGRKKCQLKILVGKKLAGNI